MSPSDPLLSAEVSQSIRHEQLISSYQRHLSLKKRSIDQPIRTEITESITDWANRAGTIGFFTNPEYRGMMGKQRSRHTLRQAVYRYYNISFQIEYRKLLIFTPKLSTAALRSCGWNSRWFLF